MANTNRRNTKPNTRGSKGRGSSKMEYSGNGADTSNSSGSLTSGSVYPELIRDSASIPFNWPAGGCMHLDSNAFDGMSIPGVLAVEIMPSIGKANDFHDPINLLANSLQTYIRKDKSGYAIYEASDIAIHLLYMSNVYQYIVWCQRLYQLTSLYSQYNRYVPRSLVTVQGVDIDDLIANLANYRYWLNSFINRVQFMYTPGILPYFKEQAMMYASIYTEGISMRDQLYMFQPAGFYEFTLDEEGWGSLRPFDHREAGSVNPNGLLRFEQIRGIGEMLLTPVLNDEDFRIMSADMRATFGEGAAIKLALVQENETIVPQFDPSILSMIHNSDCVKVNFDSFAITQDSEDLNGFLSQRIVPDVGSAGNAAKAISDYLWSDKIITVAASDPTPGDIINATRLCIANSTDADGDVIIGGSNVVTMFKYINMVDNVPVITSFRSLVAKAPDNADGSYASANIIPEMKKLSLVKSFKYAPEFNIYAFSTDGQIVPEGSIKAISVDNYAPIDRKLLVRMHEAYMMNVLAPASFAKVNK